MPTIDARADVQSLSPGNLVQLFDLDATAIGGGVSYFTNDVGPAGFIPWRGNNYLALPIQAEGFEIAGSTSPQKPRLKVANVLNVLASAMNTYGELIGATLIRWRTFSQYLDDGASPDPDRYLPQEIYKVDRLTQRNQLYAEWDLTTPLDAEGAKLPARQILRETCGHRYRFYDGGAFQYARVTCPYAGSNYFTDTNAPTADPALDVCALSLKACRLRFGQNAQLPILSFPAVARTRV